MQSCNIYASYLQARLEPPKRKFHAAQIGCRRESAEGHSRNEGRLVRFWARIERLESLAIKGGQEDLLFGSSMRLCHSSKIEL